MSFDTLIFWVLFLANLTVYWALPFKLQNIQLLILSLIFYSSWGLNFAAILILSCLKDFWIAQRIDANNDPKIRKFLVTSSVITNMGLLVLFKYYLVFVNELSIEHWSLPTLKEIYKWGIPVGISFYTFQILSYTIDVYRKKISATRSFPNFVLFVTFFPQLVAGPIEKARALLPQIERKRSPSSESMEQGLYLCLWGLFKKIYVGDGISHVITSFYQQENINEYGTILVIGLLSTFRVYADFSGYSDVARGLGKFLGFEITINFKPFWLAHNPSEFWQKWNISLTRWIRDYVVLSVRSRSDGLLTSSLKLIFVMALVGVWHAAKLNWVIFGLFNGLLLVLHQLVLRFKIWPHLTGPLLLVGLYIGNGLLHFVPDASSIQKLIVPFGHYFFGPSTSDLLSYAWPLVLPILLVESLLNLQEPGHSKYLNSFMSKVAFCTLCLTGIFMLERSVAHGFIYFNF
jgi:alginate O-acetyltransferase complex protein AlgI